MYNKTKIYIHILEATMEFKIKRLIELMNDKIEEIDKFIKEMNRNYVIEEIKRDETLQIKISEYLVKLARMISNTCNMKSKIIEYLPKTIENKDLYLDCYSIEDVLISTSNKLRVYHEPNRIE